LLKSENEKNKKTGLTKKEGKFVYQKTGALLDSKYREWVDTPRLVRLCLRPIFQKIFFRFLKNLLWGNPQSP
jgi:hypothetical protein